MGSQLTNAAMVAAQNATGSATFIAHADLDEARAVNAQLALMPHHDVSTAEGLAQIRIAFAPPGASVLRPAEVMIDGPGGPLFFERNDPWLLLQSRDAVVQRNAGQHPVSSPTR